jgi:hypothetical protein
MPETTMHVCVPALPAVQRTKSAHLAARATYEWCSDDTAGDARPTREDALRWVHENAMEYGSCAPPESPVAGDDLRAAAHVFAFWKEARKLRWGVCKGVRTGCASASAAQPRMAADGTREAAASPPGGAEGRCGPPAA